MASPEVLAIETLVQPIEGDNPAGEDLREDSSPTALYHQIKDVRTTARADERRRITADPSERDGIRPDWRPLLELAPKALAERSKDLEITAWLIEALARESGFAGLRDGFKLARLLIENFWDALYPMPDEDGLEGRLAALTGLNGDDAQGTLIAPISMIPVTEPTSFDDPFSRFDYQQAAELDRIGDAQKKQARIDDGAVSMQMFDKAVAETPRAYFVGLEEDIQQALEEFQSLTQTLDERAGRDSPPSSNIRNEIQVVLEAVQQFAASALAEAQDEEEAASAVEGEGAASVPGAVAGVIQSREDAFRTLDKVARFFRQTEPHSPMSYALERVVRWGKLPLPELVAELIEDAGARDRFSKLSGVDFPTE